MQRSGRQRLAPEMAFATVIREARKERELSQEALGFESGYHRTYIGMLERGLMNPSLRTILSIASALEIPAGELVRRVEALIGKAWRRPEKRAADKRRDA
jgi:transcriptional regulator with XRE-family HTH domain